MRLAGLGYQKSVFASRLCGLVIDEAHLVYVWRQFRTNYASLSRMRTLWPKIPIMTLSATFAPHVAGYVHKSLELMTGAKLIRRQIDRPNVYLARRAITNQSTFEDLDFIIPNYACDIRMIPKTMIFVDSRPMVCTLTDYLLKKLALAWLRSGVEEPEDVVADYTSILSDERRTQVLAKFREGSCRVIACTDAAGMGIDIRDVKRVIQWKATSILNLASYFQRVGRAGRAPSCESVAIMFYQASLSQLENEYALYREDIQGERGTEILKNIRAFDRGTDDGALVRRGKRTLKNILQNRGLESQTQREESSTDPRKLICRGLLSQIGTMGCMRASILRYFDFHTSDVPPERCCDSCIQKGALELPLSISSLLPEHIVDNYREDQDGLEEAEDEEEEENLDEFPPPTQTNSAQPITLRQARIPGLNPEQIAAFQDALFALRTKIWSSQFNKAIQYKLTPFRANIFLTDLEITRLSKNGHKILQVEDIAKYLNVKKNFQWTLIAPYIADVLKCIKETYVQNAPPPTAPRVIRVRKPKPIATAKVNPLHDDEVQQRKRQLRREANQRYYAKQKALKSEAHRILSDISKTVTNIAPSGLSHPASGTPATAPIQVMTANLTAPTAPRPANFTVRAATTLAPTATTLAPTAGGIVTDTTLHELPHAPNVATNPLNNTRGRKNPFSPNDKENSAKRPRLS